MLKRCFLFLTVLTVLASCASAPLQQNAVHGLAIDTLQGSVNISLSSPAGQMAGNGALFYKRPDSFRISILAPFGQVIFDIIVEGEQVLCLMESRKKGWQGNVSDIPGSLGTKIWPLLKWVMEPPHPPGPALERVFSRNNGTVEKIYYDTSGFVLRKVNNFSDEILYSDYQIVENIAFPGKIVIKTAAGDTLELVFNEPELNHPVESGIFTPNHEGFDILPLAEFKGF